MKTTWVMETAKSRRIIFSFFLILLTGALIAGSGGRALAKATDSQPVKMIPASFSDIAEQASQAVVNISTVKKPEAASQQGRPGPGPFQGHGPFDEYFERFFKDMRPRGVPRQNALGSGFIIDPSGLIVTNNHVVEDATEITVKTQAGDEYKAKVLGRDPKTDLALLKVDAGKDLPYLKLGDSSQAKIGDWVVAIGNPFGLEHTVTSGIISARGRAIGAGPYDDFLQTDASINPGNSGGPLLNLDGEVIGINTAIVAGGAGIGFAIPANLAQNIVAQLKTSGHVVRGWLGVMIQNVTADLAKSFGLEKASGALVADVAPNGPAKEAGIERGDVIVAFNGQTIEDSADLPTIVAQTPVGEKVDVDIVRDGHAKTVQVEIGRLQEEQVASATATEDNGYGLSVQELTPELAGQMGLPEKDGVIINDIDNNSPAANSGLRAGDLILEINHKPVKNLSDYQALIAKAGKKAGLLLLVKRGPNTMYFTVKA